MSAVLLEDRLGTAWKKPPLISNPMLRWGLFIAAAVYLVLATASIDVNWSRVAEGLSRGWAFIASFFNPDFVSRGTDIRDGILESVIITVASTVVGHPDFDSDRAWSRAQHRAASGLPRLPRHRRTLAGTQRDHRRHPAGGDLRLRPARRLPHPVVCHHRLPRQALGRGHRGDGQGAGGSHPRHRLDLDAMDQLRGQPQVMPRLIGLSMYRLDINFRESAILGLVGAGGIGATLNTAFDRYEFDTAAAILLIIIVTVMVLEYLSGIIRAKVQ
jgi:phosphonate transport system permease protein